MNEFLKAIGFSEYKLRKDINALLTTVPVSPKDIIFTDTEDQGRIYEFTNYYGDNFGIKIYASEDSPKDFNCHSYIPFFEGTHFFNPNDLNIDKRYNGFSFIGSLDDLRVGVSIIFQLVNPMHYVNHLWNAKDVSNVMIAFSALSLSGTILLPITYNKGEIKRKIDNINRRASLVAAARQGDEKAIESLTFEDMDTYAKISKRIHTEDIFTIVDSSFIPYGLESDLYTIIADITAVKKTVNILTYEEIFILTLNYNGIEIDTAINKDNLIGEPMVGRRFKGVIWLMATIKE